MSSALDFQSLPHYSDFDTTSESGLSDVSYVRPQPLKKFPRRNKPTPDSENKAVKRGARAMRRYANEVFLTNLSVIAEVDKEDPSFTVWPDCISTRSVFTKLFEDESLREVWDRFVSMSEIEQAKLLRALHPSRSDWDDSNSDVDTVDESLSDGSPTRSVVCPRPYRLTRRSKVRQNKCESRTTKSGVSDVESEDNQSPTAPDHVRMSFPVETELRGCLPPRFLTLLSRSVHVAHGRRRQGRRTKRVVTPLDLCLIDCVESELREWFSSSTDSDSETMHSSVDPTRWTPTVSLLDETHLQQWIDENGSFPELLRLDAFGRLLIHCCASYLGLCSYSGWSEQLSDRQLWVEHLTGQPFAPPSRTLVDILKARFLEPS